MENKNGNYLVALTEEVIVKANKESNPNISEMNKNSELKIHKILYFLYGFYYAKYNKELFDADFQAWRYGPVEQHYRYGSRKDFYLNYELDEEDFIIEKLEKLMATNAWDLVDFSHETKPWIDANSKQEMYTTIPNEEIQSYFVGLLENGK